MPIWKSNICSLSQNQLFFSTKTYKIKVLRKNQKNSLITTSCCIFLPNLCVAASKRVVETGWYTSVVSLCSRIFAKVMSERVLWRAPCKFNYEWLGTLLSCKLLWARRGPQVDTRAAQNYNFACALCMQELNAHLTLYRKLLGASEWIAQLTESSEREGLRWSHFHDLNNACPVQSPCTQ
jgi:hypothetical protein